MNSYRSAEVGKWVRFPPSPPKKKLKKLLDKFKNLCYNKGTEKGRESQATPSPIQKVQKLLKKVLDKQHKMCYNKNVKRNTSYR